MDWISVKDRLPEPNERVLAYFPAMRDSEAVIQMDAPAGAAEGGTHMTAKRLSALLVLALAAIALTVCAGLAAGVSMWPWIVGYWAVLTVKNIVDLIGRKKE